MGEELHWSRPARALGAALLAALAVTVLWVVHGLWMTGSAPKGADPVRLVDLADAARFARRSPSAGPMSPTQRAGRLSLPAKSEISWSLRLSENAELRIGAVTLPKGRSGEWVVHSAAGGEPLRVPMTPCKACQIDLRAFSGQIVRLTVRALRRQDGAPGALEIVEPVLFGSPSPPVTTLQVTQPASVIIYLIDTLRPDKLGVYGNPSGLTPQIDAFAAQATVFDNAIAQAPWTKPSVASIFTGLYARVHGIISMGAVLPDEALTLAELLRDGGYTTGAVVTNGLVDADFGFDQGFDHFARERGHAPDVTGLEGFRADKPAIDSDVAQAAVWSWLDEPEGDPPFSPPFFLYVHVLDPHVPHFPPEPFKTRFASEVDRFDLGSMESVRAMDEQWKRGEETDARSRAHLEALYDAEIAHNDHQFGLFIDELQRRDLWDDSLVVLVSDHGEAFWEHGYRGHGRGLHEELLRVPLIVKAPGQTTPLRVSRLAQHVDLMPTILAYAGLETPEGLHGQSLRAALEGARDDVPSRPRLAVSHGTPGTAVREGRWKAVKHSGEFPSLELFDLESDPDETRNVAEEHPIVMRYLLESVARLEAGTRASAPPREQRDLTPEKAAELRALGYLE